MAEINATEKSPKEASAKGVAARFKAAANFTMPRSIYLPAEVRDQAPLTPEGTDLAIWQWEGQGKFYAIAFAAKQNKPLWNYSFKSDANRQRQIDETVKSRKLSLEFKQKRVDDRKNHVHGFVVGDILYSTWGYDQTNVNFFQVVEVKGKVIVTRPIGSKVVRESQGASYVVAVPNSFHGPAERSIPGPNGTKIDGHHASKWDGKEKYETSSGWGH